jgi:hypothetical protein
MADWNGRTVIRRKDWTLSGLAAGFLVRSDGRQTNMKEMLHPLRNLQTLDQAPVKQPLDLAA